MTKNEALKKCIDGKRVSVNIFAVKWNGKYFSDDDGFEYCISKLPDSGWKIVPEYVSFDVAWKAYESGKEIKSASSNWHKKYEHEDSAICLSDIRGKWLILEDE